MQLEGYRRNELSSGSGNQTSLIQETLCYPLVYAKVLHWAGSQRRAQRGSYQWEKKELSGAERGHREVFTCWTFS